MKSNIFFLPLLLFFNSTVKAQHIGPAIGEQSLEEVFWESIQTQGTALDSLMVWQEQVLLHTDREALAPKDHLFFKAYILTGPEQLRVSASDVLKVELLNENGTLVNSQYHKISNGSAEGSIKIPKKAKSGKHYVRAYTRWMLNYGPENFATKEIAILDGRKDLSDLASNPSEVEIFPEGGTIIVGLENRVVVNMNNLQSNLIEVIDGNGEKVAKVQNYGNGLGTFLFTPQKEKKYYLKLGESDRVALPDAGETGYTMQFNNIGSHNIVAKIVTTDNLKNQDVYIRGRVNGISLFEAKVDFKNSNSVEIDIPKSDLPNGIIQLQLEDEFNQVWATRPLHVDNNQLHFEIKKPTDSERDLVKIKVTDSEGKPVKTELSIALGKDGSNIDHDSPRNQRFVNDLLVLTNKLPEDYALNRITALPTEIKYNFQEGLEFYGRAYDLDAVPLSNTKIQIVISGNQDAVAQEVMTNEEGLFKLSGLQVQGDADMVFRRASEEERDKYVKVVPYQYEIPPLKLKNDGEGGSSLNSKQFIPKKQVIEFRKNENLERLITLEGVTLIGEKPKASRTPALYGITPSRVTYQDPERPKTIPQLFLNIPGVQVTNLGNINPPPSVSLPKAAGSGPVLWVIDGIPLSQAPVEVGTTPLADVMSLIPFTDVERIELLFGPDASMFGSRASGGAILVYTRNGSDENYFNRKKAQLTFEGYHDSLSFDAYQEEYTGKRNKTESNIIYWNPSLETDENGEASIVLPETTKESVQLDIKSITPDGKKGSLRTVL